MDVSDEEFQELIDRALQSLPGEHVKNVKNVAFIYSSEPSPEQRVKLSLRNDQSLLGLYEGVPLPQRQGMTRLYPDKITLFKLPLISISRDRKDLFSNIRHTLWHEIAHYYGLDHEGINRLDRKL
jgi:predicted Zn-dependent protease with MMP-like domain